jgi:hypothetical protein
MALAVPLHDSALVRGRLKKLLELTPPVLPLMVIVV